ncbi:MAG: helix-turn-helix domain-containing protein [[Clostridium] leptum]
MLEHEEFAQEGTIIRDILRAKRAAMPELTNQDIANMAGLSVNTVNHCLSDRSKSSSAFTIGRLCKALHVSFDQCFGIEPDEKKDSPEKENALLSEIEALQEKCDGLKQELERKEDLEAEPRYLSELERSAKTHRKFSRWMAGLCTLLLLLFRLFNLFDLPNPEYGIIRSEAFYAITRTCLSNRK